MTTKNLSQRIQEIDEAVAKSLRDLEQRIERLGKIADQRDRAAVKGAEEMRARVLELIKGWRTNSKDNKACMFLLNALAGDVQVIRLSEKK